MAPRLSDETPLFTAAYNQIMSALASENLDAVRDAGKKWVLDIANDATDDGQLTATQRLCQAVTAVTKFVRSSVNYSSSFVPHISIAVQGPSSRRPRHFRERRHILQSRRFETSAPMA